MQYVIAYNRPWCEKLPERLEKKMGKSFIPIDNKNDLNQNYLNKINPEFIFFPHWSYLIPGEIYKKFKSVIFHMTDLPYGRGGSPLQNLIVRGHNETMISAIKCGKNIDSGPVYLKKPLSLLGSAEEIFIRANKVIENMIIEILETNPEPIDQQGEIVKFQRRVPEEGDWSNVGSLDEVFNYIRMLDAEDYPPAFIRIGKYNLEFYRASLMVKTIHASVEIIEEGKNE